MIEAAVSIGIANPMPWAFDAVAELSPITWPRASRSGPPLLPAIDRRVRLEQAGHRPALAGRLVEHGHGPVRSPTGCRS